MIEVFITNIQNHSQARQITNVLKKKFPYLKIDYDLNETDLPFPCGHTVLRVEGTDFNVTQIINQVKNQGVHCEIMKDTICS